MGGGSERGAEWNFALALGRSSSGNEGLCLAFDLGSTTGGFDCILDGHLGFSPDNHLWAAADWTQQGISAFYGKVSRSASGVKIIDGEGTSSDAKLYPGPSSLRLPFRFFVGFAPAGTDASIEVLGSGGSTIDQMTWDALPRLVVTKSGEGTGLVEGTATCPGCPPDARRNVRISCGATCFAEVAPHSWSHEIVLEPQPEPRLHLCPVGGRLYGR